MNPIQAQHVYIYIVLRQEIALNGFNRGRSYVHAVLHGAKLTASTQGIISRRYLVDMFLLNYGYTNHLKIKLFVSHRSILEWMVEGRAL